eukprot:2035630-Pleurochrysis_carterae.AAC.1
MGKNGTNVKGQKWFDQVHACFALPTYPNSSIHTDPFFPVRMFWDALRDAFNNAIVCGWLMVLDESM